MTELLLLMTLGAQNFVANVRAEHPFQNSCRAFSINFVSLAAFIGVHIVGMTEAIIGGGD